MSVAGTTPVVNCRPPREVTPDFASNASADFNLWLTDLEDYFAITGVTVGADKKHLVLNLAGLSLRGIVKGLDVRTPSRDTDNVYTVPRDALRHYFRPSVNRTAERHRFTQMAQEQGEAVSAFMARLRAKEEFFQFQSTSVDTVENSQKRDQLIAGLSFCLSFFFTMIHMSSGRES